MFSPPRICHVGIDACSASNLADIADLGFSHVLANAAVEISQLMEKRPRGLKLLLDINMVCLDPDHPLVRAHPEHFMIRQHAREGALDPRQPLAADSAVARICETSELFANLWREELEKWLAAGANGFRIFEPHRGREIWRKVIAQIRAHSSGAIFIANTPGLAREDMTALEGCGFDFCLSSLPWWDRQSPWLTEEYATLTRVAPVIATVESPQRRPPEADAREARLMLAAITGSGVMMPHEFGDGVEDSVRKTNALVAREPVLAEAGPLKLAQIDSGSIILRVSNTSPCALVAVADGDVERAPDRRARSVLKDWNDLSLFWKNGSVALYRAQRTKPVRATRQGSRSARQAANEPRIIISQVSPSVDNGAFPAKRIVGDTVRVEADIFTDGHPMLVAELFFRAEDERNWQRAPMHLIANDRWFGEVLLSRLGRYRFMIEAWIDVYGGFARDLAKKREAGTALSVDILDGRNIIEAARQRAPEGTRAALDAFVTHFDKSVEREQIDMLLAPETLDAMRRADDRPFRVQSASYTIIADREAAGFASWYELFPRSQTNDSARHGTFADVIKRLPVIRDMGFDVLYLPPIHPVGTTNRKGRNNALKAEPGDPGSVYAIGSPQGGHDAIDPQLGTLGDFHALILAAREYGMEIALDFAVQCSPDHPWLKEHPGWFDWRADGSIKYAENPPKKYEDIVNVDFYAEDAVPDLWQALRDIVLFWAEKGVRIFRVDNPHTKPFAFWQWMIAEVRAANPDVFFLSEAFTRPKIMYHLAKLGFTQSYTYFTWRNTKVELTSYMKELTAAPVSDFFRPHFFVNTPDINPYFLQTSGRPGFLIRAALAATLSGVWGVYSGFELCEAEALPGREEYLDSEKYAVKPRDWNAPGNIIAEIAKLNALRRAYPALQTHMGITFYNAFNDQVIYYGKHAPGYNNRILVMILLDPHNAQSVSFEIPLWEWGLPDSEALEVEDLLNGARFIWHGKIQYEQLVPDAPYRIWQIRPLKKD